MTTFQPVRHHAIEHCFCCGTENPHSMRLKVFSHAEGLFAQARLSYDHEGAEGSAHGGAIAALFDELIGSVADHLQTPAVTANLSVDFRAPIPLPATLDLWATWPEIDGRKLWFRSTARLDGRLVAEAAGLWITRRPDD